MNTSTLAKLLENPDQISANHTSAMLSIVDEYPYFQAARALYLKGLHNASSFKYNQELKTTAAYTTDRSILFDYITSKEFHQNKISSSIQHNFEHIKHLYINDIEELSVQKSVVIDDALREEIKSTQPLLNKNLFERKEDENHQNLSNTEAIETPEKKLELGKPLNFDKNETHSFSEWLKLTRIQPIKRDDDAIQTQSKSIEREEKFNLIDKFIATNPKIIPTQNESETSKINMENHYHPEALMTETLARIYLEQKNYSKAIQAFKILSLKYPEKSSFFADRIKAVKDIQQQNK